MLFSPFASSSSTAANSADTASGTPPVSSRRHTPDSDKAPLSARAPNRVHYNLHPHSTCYQIVDHNSGSSSAPGHFHSLSQERALSALAVGVHQFAADERLKPGNSSLSDPATPGSRQKRRRAGPNSPLSPRTRPLETGHWQVLGEGILIKPLSDLETQLALSSTNSREELQEARSAAERFFHSPRARSPNPPERQSPDVIAATEGMEHGSTTVSGVPATGTANGTSGEGAGPGDSPSHYGGEFYWDTNGEHAIYDSSGDSLLFPSSTTDYDSSLFGARARLGRTQEDLNKYRQRIDANVEQQREYSEIIADMQAKLQEYRRHISELERRLRGGPSTLHETSLFPLADSGFGATTIGGVSGGGGDTTIIGDGGAWAGGRLGRDANSNYELMFRLDEERRRTDEVRNQLELERQSNEHLQHEVERVRRDHEKEMAQSTRHFQSRERNLSQYLSDEQRKLLDVWTELQRVRKQFAELKERTEKELDNQRSDFTRIIRSIQGVTRHLAPGEALPDVDYGGISGGGGPSSNYNTESLIIDILRRGRNGVGTRGALGADLELLSQLKSMMGGKPATADDSQLVQELIRKYEEAIERNIELESKGDENARRVGELEAELRRTKERLQDAQDAIRKMYDMSRQSQKAGDEEGKRARSLSPPGNGGILPDEAIRSLRNALREKDNEIEQLERKLKASEKQIDELSGKYSTVEEVRRRLEKELADAKRDLTNSQKQQDSMERQLRRSEDKLKTSEYERKAAEGAQKNLEAELARLRQQFEKNTADESRKAREETDDYTTNMEADYKNRVDELNRKIQLLTEEKQRLKNDVGPMRTRQRELENELSSLQRRLEEKDSQLANSEELRQKALADFESQRQQLDSLRSELDHSQQSGDQLSRSLQALEQQLKEFKQQRDETTRQRDSLSKQLTDVRSALEKEQMSKSKGDHQQKALTEELERLKTQLVDYDKQITLLRRHNDELDSQVKSGQAKQTGVENDLLTSRKEIEKLTEMNQRLQKERQDAVNSKLEAEAEIERLKEQIRKLEAELEKLRNENKALQASEAKSKDELNQQITRSHSLKQQLDEAAARVKELEAELDRLQKELKDERARWGSRRSKGSAGKSTDPSSSTNGEEPAAAEADASAYDPEIVRIKITEINDKWKLEVERLENEKDQLEARLRDLEDQLQQAERINERHQLDVEEAKRKLQAEIDRLKQELAAQHDRHMAGLEEERESYRKNLETIRLGEEELAEKLRVAEKRLADALNIQNELERQQRDAEERMNTLVGQNQKLKDDLEDARSEADKEVQKWKSETYAVRSELKSLETTVAGLKAQLQAANERNDNLTKTVNDYVSKIRDANAQLRKLEEDLTELRANASAKDVELENANNRLRQLEEQHSRLQIEHDRDRQQLESVQREINELRTNKSQLELEVERLTRRLQESEASAKEMRNSLDHLKSDKDHLQNGYRDKAKQLSQLQSMVASLEEKVAQLRRELQDTTEKLINSDQDRNSLKSQFTKLQQELEFSREQGRNKSDEFQQAVDDLAESHRHSEDGRLNALQELELKKHEVVDLESRLDSAEQRAQQLQKDYIRADSERETLADALRRFQSTVNRVIAMGRFRGHDTDADSKAAAGDAGDRVADDSAGVNGDAYHSTPFPPQADYGHFIDSLSRGQLDPSMLDATLQQLVSRIEQLQRERDQLRDELGRWKRKSNESKSTYTKKETHLRSIEESLGDVEEEKRSLEARLATAKQLLRSQEETLKQREEDRRQLKSKMVATELELRGKEAQIRHLNEQLKNVRKDLDSAHEDLRTVRDKGDTLETGRYQLESRLRDHETEIQRMSLQLSNAENGRRSLEEKIKELSSELKSSESRYADLKEDAAKMRLELQKAEITEADLRRSLDSQQRENGELASTKDQLARVQLELQSANSKRQELESELSNTRTEIRDYKQRIHDVNSRIQDLQRSLQDAQAGKTRVDDRLHDVEKTAAAQRLTEADLRQQVEALKNEKRTLSRELDDLRNRVKQLEADRLSQARLHDQWKREKMGLVKKIEFLEAEKRRTDAAIRETALQREAIEKSLNAMERENRELYRNCQQLQQQIAQLEMENGNRIVEMTTKQKEEQERHVARIRSEKAQIEKVIEQRERGYRQRIKQLEAQLLALREQLDGERRRGRDLRDRQLLGDLGRLGPSYLSGLGSSSLGNYGAFGGNSIDGGGGLGGGGIPRHGLIRPTFASNPLTPPRGTSTPTAGTGHTLHHHHQSGSLATPEASTSFLGGGGEGSMPYSEPSYSSRFSTLSKADGFDQRVGGPPQRLEPGRGGGLAESGDRTPAGGDDPSIDILRPTF